MRAPGANPWRSTIASFTTAAAGATIGCSRGSDERELPAGVGGVEAAREQNHARPRGIEEELLLAEKFDATDSGKGGDARLVLRRDVRGIARCARSQVGIRGQDALEPAIERVAEGGDHDRHRDHRCIVRLTAPGPAAQL